MAQKQALLGVVAALAVALSVTTVAAERHVTAASGHVCVIKPGDDVECNANVDVGASPPSKTVVPAGLSFMAVTAGNDFTCGLLINGTAVCWGDFPGTAPDGTIVFIDLHAGPRHVCGLQTDGTVTCYGDSFAAVSTVPAGTYQGVATGDNVACAVARDHTVACWGDVANPVIATLPTITDADHVSVGANHACYVTTSGGVVCWGENLDGQTDVPLGLDYVWWLSAGGYSTCAISALTRGRRLGGGGDVSMAPPGVLYCWGGDVDEFNSPRSYEVACTSWGCIVLADDNNNGGVVEFNVANMGNVPLSPAFVVSAVAGSINGVADLADGPGAGARFNDPMGLSIIPGEVDDAVLVVADANNEYLRGINVPDNIVFTYSDLANDEGPYPSFNKPQSVEAVGDYLVTYETSHNTLWKEEISDFTVTLIAGKDGFPSPPMDGPGTSAQVGQVIDMRFDAPSSAVIFTDNTNQAVRVVDASGTVSSMATIVAPVYGLVLDGGGTAYVGGASCIYEVSYGGTFQVFTGHATDTGYADGSASTARFDRVTGMDWHGDYMYVIDSGNNRIRRVEYTGEVVTVVGSVAGNVDGVGINALLNRPWSLRVWEDNMFFTDQPRHYRRSAAAAVADWCNPPADRVARPGR